MDHMALLGNPAPASVAFTIPKREVGGKGL
jgi:hypothetical protein